MKYGRMVEQRPYPVNERGFPVPVEELQLPQILNGVENNHHMNYYARLFGRFAISETFRNLESFQVMMPFHTHEELHKRYSGIQLPSFNSMVDRIEQAQQDGEQMKIRALGGYVRHRITDVHLKTLYAEYNTINGAA